MTTTSPSTPSPTARRSLLLQRSPGREAYPGDVFASLHLASARARGAPVAARRPCGSMAAAPIVENAPAVRRRRGYPDQHHLHHRRTDLPRERACSSPSARGQRRACPCPVSAATAQTKAMKTAAGALRSGVWRSTARWRSSRSTPATSTTRRSRQLAYGQGSHAACCASEQYPSRIQPARAGCHPARERARACLKVSPVPPAQVRRAPRSSCSPFIAAAGGPPSAAGSTRPASGHDGDCAQILDSGRAASSAQTI